MSSNFMDPAAKMAKLKAEWAEGKVPRKSKTQVPATASLADVSKPPARRGRPPEGPVPTLKASCHPLRLAVADGLCQQCFAGRMAPPAAAEQKSPSVLAARFERLELSETQYAQEIRRQLQLRVPEYVELHVQAARLAALRGDARPAEWALQTIKVGESPVVQPVPKEGSGGGGIKVLIGVNLGGLPPGTDTTAVTVEEKSDGAKVSRPALDV